MVEIFGTLPNGQTARLYTIYGGGLTVRVTDLGATLVSVLAPDRAGQPEDVVLGYDTPQGYLENGGFLGAMVGRNANRVGASRLTVSGTPVALTPNEGPNNLHSGPDFWSSRLWAVEEATEEAVTFALSTPDGDQGFPGAGEVRVTYRLTGNRLTVTYEGRFDRDTVFNMTNHAYFNLAGQSNPQAAMTQMLTLRAAGFTEVDGGSIPTGRILPVAGTALDFRTPKALGTGREHDPLLAPQGGIDHNFVLDGRDFTLPAARLQDPASGRTLTVYTDCPGIQVYCANFLEATGKGGIRYGRNSGVCLETQFYPDSVNHPQWPQPFVKAGQTARSETAFVFEAL